MYQLDLKLDKYIEKFITNFGKNKCLKKKEDILFDNVSPTFSHPRYYNLQYLSYNISLLSLQRLIFLHKTIPHKTLFVI